jgi:hypothetical protein
MGMNSSSSEKKTERSQRERDRDDDYIGENFSSSWYHQPRLKIPFDPGLELAMLVLPSSRWIRTDTHISPGPKHDQN